MTRCFAVPACLLGLFLATGFPVIASAGTSPANAVRPSAPPVVLLSIDALMPEHLFEADEIGLKIPHLRRLLQRGSYASRVTSVFPTLTYPCHASLITGTHPDRHGIVNNTILTPENGRGESWYWFARTLKAPTLWELAGQAGLVTANIDWPVSVGAKVTHNIAQYWEGSAPLDPRFLRVRSTKGLVEQIERRVGHDYPTGDWSLAADARRLPFIVDILRNKRPHFTTAYWAALDTVQHHAGPGSAEALQTVERLDALTGSLWKEMQRIGDGQATLVLVSDHGHRRVQQTIKLNAALQQAGLIRTDEQGQLTGWDAYAWRGDATAALMLRDSRDHRTRQTVGALLARLAANPAHGIDRVLGPHQIDQLHGYPGAAFVVSAKDGYMFSEDLQGPLIAKSKYKGTHGHLPTDPAMDAVFLAVGPGVPAGKNLGSISMVDVAPTVAGLLGLSLPKAQGRDVMGLAAHGKTCRKPTGGRARTLKTPNPKVAHAGR